MQQEEQQLDVNTEQVNDPPVPNAPDPTAAVAGGGVPVDELGAPVYEPTTAKTDAPAGQLSLGPSAFDGISQWQKDHEEELLAHQRDLLAAQRDRDSAAEQAQIRAQEGQLRATALREALNSSPVDADANDITARAEAFFTFLNGSSS